MKRNVTRLLSAIICLIMVLSILPVSSFAADTATAYDQAMTTAVIAEGSASFANSSAAFSGDLVSFTPDAKGTVTVEILSCDPGYYVDVYEADEWIVDFAGGTAETVTFDVTGGSLVDIIICTYTVYSEFLKEAAAGTISYKVSFTSVGSQSGSDAPETPDLPLDEPGSSMYDPKVITGTDWTFIPGNTTVWYLYDNYRNMIQNGVYSMMLHVNSSADYSVTYRGMDVSVDEDGFVNYEMLDTSYIGRYLFSVTNHSAQEAFFSVRVADRPVYVNNGGVLVLGSNDITLDASAAYTLYEFSPSKTGVYLITAAEGLVGDWGTAFNPQDNTANKTGTLEWTCTAVGQSIMVGFTGAETTTATVERTGEYTPAAEIPYTVYENTYDFSYVMPENPVAVDIDLLDGGVHDVYLGSDGFYHYGSVCGPLVVTDLSTVEIDLKDAYTNGGLRVWLMDENGQTTSKTDYNEALYAYYKAGLVPVTEELALMLRELGEAKMWWIADGFVFGETVPADVSMAWLQLCAYLEGSSSHQYVGGICTYCGELSESISVSGTVTSSNRAEGDVTIELRQEGAEAAAYTVTAVNGVYAIEGVATGSYTMTVSKYGHVTRSYTVTVGAEAVKQDVQICLIGDVTGDGRISVGDVARVYAHVKGNAITDAYALECAEVSGDGKITIGDTAKIYAHMRNGKQLF